MPNEKPQVDLLPRLANWAGSLTSRIPGASSILGRMATRAYGDPYDYEIPTLSDVWRNVMEPQTPYNLETESNNEVPIRDALTRGGFGLPPSGRYSNVSKSITKRTPNDWLLNTNTAWSINQQKAMQEYLRKYGITNAPEYKLGESPLGGVNVARKTNEFGKPYYDVSKKWTYDSGYMRNPAFGTAEDPNSIVSTNMAVGNIHNPTPLTKIVATYFNGLQKPVTLHYNIPQE